MNDAYSTLLDIALDAASEQFRKMPSSNCWDYARHVVAAIKPLIEAQAEYITDHATEKGLGVWVVFNWDMGPYVRSIWNDELSARRAAEDYMDHVKFVEFGADFKDAVK